MRQVVVPKHVGGGKYRLRWRENGRQRQATVHGRRNAYRMADEITTRVETRGLVQPDRTAVTVGEFMVAYWRDYAIVNLARTTRDTYARVWAKHLEPRIGRRTLRELTPKRLTALRAELERAHVGAPTILKAFTLLGSVLSYAVVEEELERNPLREVKKPPQKRELDIVVPTPEQVEQVRARFLAAGDRRSATIVSLLAYGGLRTFSEIHLLEWRHVGQRALQVYATKTSRGDVIRMLAPLAQDLAEWRLASGRPGPREPVIPRADGGPGPITVSSWRYWRRKVYRPVAVAVGLESRRPYDLRHSLASLLIWEGRSLAEVAATLRHSAATCSATYLHVMEDFDIDRRVSAEDRIRAARAEQRQREMG